MPTPRAAKAVNDAKPYTPLTIEQIKARQAEREQRETVQLEALHEALGNLIGARKSAASMGSDKVLWGDWHFAKALNDLFGDDCSARALQEACDNLGVDERGHDAQDYAA